MKRPLAWALVMAVPACTVGPDYVRPELDTPDVWHQYLAVGLASGDAALQTWWSVFDDPRLG